MEFLVEIDDVVLFVLGRGLGRYDEDAGYRDDVDDLRVDLFYEVVVEDLVVFDEILFEHVLVDVFFVERGLVFEVVVSHLGVPFAGGGSGEQACNRRVATILPIPIAPGGAGV